MSQRMLSLLILLMVGTLFSETTINRRQFWGRVTYMPKLEKGLGLMISGGMRDNFSITKEVGGIEKPAVEQKFWLKELMIGPTFGKSISPKLSFNTQLLYRPQFWYPDSRGGESYLRHTIMYNGNLFQKLGKVNMHYRLSLWHQFAAEQSGSVTKEYDNELYLRLMAGPMVPLGKRVVLFSKVEPFIKVTASDSDSDGTEYFNKVILWNGLTYKLSKELSLSTQYVYMSTFPKESISVNDHYIYLHMTFTPTFRAKK